MADTLPDTPAELPAVAANEARAPGVPLGTPPDLVFDDEPVETLLYGENEVRGPSPANIFAPARQARERIRKALADHNPQEAFLIAESLVREGHDIPGELWKELTPIWQLLAVTPPPSVAVSAFAAAESGATQHLAILFDLAFHDFVHGLAERGRRLWQMAAEVSASHPDADDPASRVLPDIARWWWSKYPTRFPVTARMLVEAGWEAPDAAIGQPPALPLSFAALPGVRELVQRYRSAELQEKSRQLFDVTVVMAAVSEAAGPSDAAVAPCLNLLAGLLRGEGEYDTAITLARQALALCEHAFGGQHLNVIRQLHSLAALLCLKAEYAEAELLYRRALEICERILGPERPDTLLIANNLADLWEKIGRIEESTILRRRSVEILERTKGEEHPDTLRGWNNFAATLRRHGLPNLAEPIDRKDVGLTIKTLGESHPLTIHRRNNIVLSLLMMGRLAEAEECLDLNWNTDTPLHVNTTPRVCFLRAVLALLADESPQAPIDDLKTMLLGELLPANPEISVPWGVDYFLKALQPKLPEGSFEFLTAVVAVLDARSESVHDRSSVKRLEQFAIWRHATSDSWAEPSSSSGPDDMTLTKEENDWEEK